MMLIVPQPVPLNRDQRFIDVAGLREPLRRVDWLHVRECAHYDDGNVRELPRARA